MISSKMLNREKCGMNWPWHLSQRRSLFASWVALKTSLTIVTIP